MDELPIKVRELLHEARLAHEPPIGARERMQARLAAAVSCEGLRLEQRDALPSARETWTKLGLTTVLLTILGASRFWLPQETPPESHPRASSRAWTAPTAEREASRSIAEPADTDSAAPTGPLMTFDSREQRAERRPRRNRARNTDGTLVAELNLLKQASDALVARDFTRADELLELHRTRFANGQLLAERDGLDLVRRCLAGAPDAKARARSYLQAMPHGVLSVRIENACSGLQ